MRRPVYNSLFVFVALLGIGLMGCDSAAIDETEPPEVVSAEAFSVETFSPDANKSDAGAHLTAAMLRYVPVSVTLGATYLLIPRLVTEVALQEEPEFVDGAFVWSATPGSGAAQISFTLTGRPGNGEVDWSMLVSGNNAYTGQVDEFELYTATTAFDGKSGSWSLFYKIDDESQHVLDAEFTVDSDTEKQITFTVPATAGQYAGYEVRYERDGDVRSFYWFQPDTDEEHTLTWNPESGQGSIQSTNYEDGERYCWDAAGEDVACTETAS